MSFSVFLLCLAAAAALLAAWLVVRFPDVSPRRPARRSPTHFGISLTLVSAVPNAVALLPPVGLLPAVTPHF